MVSYRRLAATLAVMVVVAALGAASPARATTTMLYDGAVAGQTLSDQGSFTYQTYPSPPVFATTFYAAGGTTLRTTGAAAESAGYYTPAGTLPALSRTAGYTLTFTVRVVDEVHQSPDRAGFSALILGDDSWGVELGFWGNEVWAQNDGRNDPTVGAGLWTHGEGATLNTTAGLVSYSVVVKGDDYSLLADGAQVLTGPLRKYAPLPAEVLANPLRGVYHIPNLVFLGDNTSTSAAEVRLTRVEIALASTTPPPSPSASPSASPTASPTIAPAATPQVYLPALSR
jgi:hypothetical protein